MRLNAGKGAIQTLFAGKDSACGWGWLSRSLDSFQRGNREKAIDYLIKAIEFNYGVQEAFGPKLRSRQGIRIMSNMAAPPVMQEFMHRTQPYWDSNPGARRFYALICNDPHVQVRVEDFHLEKTAGIGLYFKSPEFQANHQRREGELREALHHAVKAAAPLNIIWP